MARRLPAGLPPRAVPCGAPGARGPCPGWARCSAAGLCREWGVRAAALCLGSALEEHSGGAAGSRFDVIDCIGAGEAALD